MILSFVHCSSDGTLPDGGTDGAATDGNKISDAGGDAASDAKSDAQNGNAAVVNLATAGNYVMLAKTGISNVPASAITGDVAVSPAAASYLTGFSLTADSTNVFSTSSQVTGKLFASDYSPPTPSNLTTAIGDMQLAFTDAAGRAPDVTELGAGNIGGMTLTRGVYKWGSGLLVPTNLTLTGAANDVWIFQVAQDLTVSSGTQIILSGGATAKNVFWQVAGAVDLETTAQFQGIVLCQ
ncbi:MAG TPA: ice-binding family protein, partial [Polyangiaceae bacterium]